MTASRLEAQATHCTWQYYAVALTPGTIFNIDRNVMLTKTSMLLFAVVSEPWFGAIQNNRLGLVESNLQFFILFAFYGDANFVPYEQATFDFLANKVKNDVMQIGMSRQKCSNTYMYNLQCTITMYIHGIHRDRGWNFWRIRCSHCSSRGYHSMGWPITKAKIIRIVDEVENCLEYRNNRFNGDNADPYGRLFAGTMRKEQRDSPDISTYGNLSRFAVDQRAVTLIEIEKHSNFQWLGLGWEENFFITLK